MFLANLLRAIPGSAAISVSILQIFNFFRLYRGMLYPSGIGISSFRYVVCRLRFKTPAAADSPASGLMLRCRHNNRPSSGKSFSRSTRRPQLRPIAAGRAFSLTEWSRNLSSSFSTPETNSFFS